MSIINRSLILAARAEAETGSPLLLGSQRLLRHRLHLSRLISMQGARPPLSGGLKPCCSGREHKMLAVNTLATPAALKCLSLSAQFTCKVQTPGTGPVR